MKNLYIAALAILLALTPFSHAAPKPKPAAGTPISHAAPATAKSPKTVAPVVSQAPAPTAPAAVTPEPLVDPKMLPVESYRLESQYKTVLLSQAEKELATSKAEIADLHNQIAQQEFYQITETIKTNHHWGNEIQFDFKNYPKAAFVNTTPAPAAK